MHSHGETNVTSGAGSFPNVGAITANANKANGARFTRHVFNSLSGRSKEIKTPAPRARFFHRHDARQKSRSREEILTFGCGYVQLNRMRSRQLHDALEQLTKAIREVEAVLQTMRAEHDPLASHIFVSRRHYQDLSDTKGGKRRAMSAHLSWQTACELGFRGNLAEWERLMGAAAQR